MFAADAADVRHVPPVPADGQSTLAGDFALLFRAHRGKPTATLLLAAGPTFGFGAPPRLTALASSAPRLRSTTAGASARAALFSGSLLFLGLLGHAAAPIRLRTASGGALPVWLFGLDPLLVGLGHGSIRLPARAAPCVFGFCDRNPASQIFVITWV